MCRRLVNVLVGISFREYSIILSVKVKNVYLPHISKSTRSVD